MTPPYWPWDAQWFKPSTPRRMLEKAGALILVEIERIDRASDSATASDKGGSVKAAVVSECGTYRYLLTRPAPVGLDFEQPCVGTALFVMLNPSTADATVDDPTIRRCKSFAYRWGCNGIAVVNLYGLRSPSPADLWKHADPIGPDNDMWLRTAAREHETVVFAWGANARPDRVREVYEIFRPGRFRKILCLGTTKDGSPRHPLYVRADQPLIEWAPIAASDSAEGGA